VRRAKPTGEEARERDGSRQGHKRCEEGWQKKKARLHPGGERGREGAREKEQRERERERRARGDGLDEAAAVPSAIGVASKLAGVGVLRGLDGAGAIEDAGNGER
jgi:hypothetical protein